MITMRRFLSPKKLKFVLLSCAFSCGVQQKVLKKATEKNIAQTQGEDAAQAAHSPSQNTDQQKIALPTTLPCDGIEKITETPERFEDVVAIINKLPMPLSMPCFVKALPKNVKINATASDLSVQPAKGPQSPRIFIQFGELLLLSVVPEGDGAKGLELSYLVGDTQSIKGEIAFPVIAKISSLDPYKNIVRTEGGGTRCVGCHVNEGKASSEFPVEAYVSKAIKPFLSRNISLKAMQALHEGCGKDETFRCQLLRAVFDREQVTEFIFPALMPTMF